MMIMTPEEKEGATSSSCKPLMVGEEEAQQIIEEMESELRGLRQKRFLRGKWSGDDDDDEGKDEVSSWPKRGNLVTAIQYEIEPGLGI